MLHSICIIASYLESHINCSIITHDLYITVGILITYKSFVLQIFSQNVFLVGAIVYTLLMSGVVHGAFIVVPVPEPLPSPTTIKLLLFPGKLMPENNTNKFVEGFRKNLFVC